MNLGPISGTIRRIVFMPEEQMIQVKWEIEGATSMRRWPASRVQLPAGSLGWLAVRGRTVEGLIGCIESCCPALKSQTDERTRRVLGEMTNSYWWFLIGTVKPIVGGRFHLICCPRLAPASPWPAFLPR